MPLSPTPLIVIGAGGFAREIIWLAREATAPFEVVGILDDNAASHGQTICDVPVLGPIDDWSKHAAAQFVVAIGAPRVRQKIVARMQSGSVMPQFATLIHDSVRQSRYVQVAEGSMITAGCILTTQVSVGRHVIINLSSTIGHDTVLQDFCTVAPLAAISGMVTLEAGSEVGTAACLRQGIRVGRGAMLGMGAVVTRDVGAAEVVVGNPAKALRSLDPF